MVESPSAITRRHALALSLGCAALTPWHSSGQSPETQSLPSSTAVPPPVTWAPRPAFIGGPILFRSNTFSGPATWLGKTIVFRPGGGRFSALAGVNLNQQPGRYPLVLGGETIEVRVATHAYPSSTIRVPQRYVTPPREVLARIREETAIKRAAFRSSPPDRLWEGPFVPPASTRFTSSFGSRRIYNGKTRSTHQGLDYSASLGSEVRASNRGKVVIAREMYFEGGFVLLDHGESIFTLYMHLSAFHVAEGASVEKGVVIAKSGASGRATGPHLHFGVQWQGTYLEPSTLFGLWDS